jgi:hypothetical protein
MELGECGKTENHQRVLNSLPSPDHARCALASPPTTALRIRTGFAMNAAPPVLAPAITSYHACRRHGGRLYWLFKRLSVICDSRREGPRNYVVGDVWSHPLSGLRCFDQRTWKVVVEHEPTAIILAVLFSNSTPHLRSMSDLCQTLGPRSPPFN